ncbi:MAG: adenosine kinase [Dysgonamonadaceae bacterium]|jgi:sugar/nucleoside kinase (ribokinase family)|nr:adenosine kinase [Dysgonamonadaceae bacterium]
MSTLGLGNALVDILLKLENDATLAETGIVKGAMDMIDENQMIVIQRTLSHLERSQTPGGSVCNSMRAIANLGAPAGFIGKIGSDATGVYYEQALLEAGVTPYFAKTEGISGCCTVLISPDGERTMATFLGPAPTLRPEDIDENIVARYDYMYIEGYLLVNEPLVRAAMKKAKQAGVKIALDLSNFNIVNAFRGMLDDIIPAYVDILFSNESEAKAFTGLEPEEAIRTLADSVEIAVVTCGKEGSLVSGRGERLKIAAEGGKPLDTTGAGDHFAAGFLYGQSVGASLEQSARIGSMLAGYVINVIGPQILGEQWKQIKLKVSGILS